MPSRIEDEFTYRSLTRQRRYQLRQRKLGRCMACGKASGGPQYCAVCVLRVYKREKELRKEKRR